MTPQPGIYASVPFSEYIAWDAINASLIKQAYLRDGSLSMAHFKAAKDAPKKESTDALLFGIMTHVGQLEPLKLMQRYVVMPPFEKDAENKTAKGLPTQSKVTAYYKAKVLAFETMHAGKECVEQEDFDLMLAMLDAISKHDMARRYFESEGPTELSILWDDPDTGIRCKARIDKVAHALASLPDLKTCADASMFEGDILNYRYDVQQAFYRDGWHEASGKDYQPVLIAVDKKAPHRVCPVPLGKRYVELGRDKYKRVLSGMLECEASGKWPFPPDPVEWNPPAWAEKGGGDEPLNAETFLEIP